MAERVMPQRRRGIPDPPPELGRPCVDCGTDLSAQNTSQCAVPTCTGRAHRYGPPCATGMHRIYCHAHQPTVGHHEVTRKEAA